MGDELENDAEELLQKAPKPTPGIDEQVRAEREAKEREWDHLKDAQMRSFDPAIHETKPDGSPELTKAGNLRMKRGRKASSTTSQNLSQPGTAGKLNLPDAKDRDQDYRALARLCVSNLLGALQMLLGPDWAPQVEDGIDERVGMIDAWAAYFRSRGIAEVNPLLMVATVSLGYAAAPSPVPYKDAQGQAVHAPRFAAPHTKLRALAVYGAVRSKIHGARTDPGPNRMRQDDAGEASSASMH